MKKMKAKAHRVSTLKRADLLKAAVAFCVAKTQR